MARDYDGDIKHFFENDIDPDFPSGSSYIVDLRDFQEDPYKIAMGVQLSQNQHNIDRLMLQDTGEAVDHHRTLLQIALSLPELICLKVIIRPDIYYRRTIFNSLTHLKLVGSRPTYWCDDVESDIIRCCPKLTIFAAHNVYLSQISTQILRRRAIQRLTLEDIEQPLDYDNSFWKEIFEMPTLEVLDLIVNTDEARFFNFTETINSNFRNCTFKNVTRYEYMDFPLLLLFPNLKELTIRFTVIYEVDPLRNLMPVLTSLLHRGIVINIKEHFDVSEKDRYDLEELTQFHGISQNIASQFRVYQNKDNLRYEGLVDNHRGYEFD